MREKLASETLPRWFGNLEKRFERFGNGPFAVGNSFTIADLKVATVAQSISGGSLDHIPTTIFDNYPRLQSLIKNFKENTKVQQYYETDRKSVV